MAATVSHVRVGGNVVVKLYRGRPESAMCALEETWLASFKDGGHSQPCGRGRKRGLQVLKMAATVSHVGVGGKEACKF
jgi:hypothetical protein